MIHIQETPEKVAQQFAEDFYKLTEKAYADNKPMHVALSGGSTPKILFEILRYNYHAVIAWKNIHFYWGDERMVMAESTESNYGEAKRYLFDYIAIPKINIHPIMGDQEPFSELERYSRVLELNLTQKNNLPAFDLVILGMGDDGHTASIFPDQMDLLKSEKLVELAWHPSSKQMRISLTGPVINNATQVVFLITGNAKAPALAKILNKKDSYLDYPAAQINPYTRNLNFYLDSEAAALIDKNII